MWCRVKYNITGVQVLLLMPMKPCLCKEHNTLITIYIDRFHNERVTIHNEQDTNANLEEAYMYMVFILCWRDIGWEQGLNLLGIF